MGFQESNILITTLTKLSIFQNPSLTKGTFECSQIMQSKYVKYADFIS